MSLYEFNSSVVYYGVLTNSGGPMTDKDFDDALAEIRAYDLPDVEI